MARTKGSKNKVTISMPDICTLSSEQRIELLANLMIDRILEDQASGQKLLKHLGGTYEPRKAAAA